MFANRRKFSLKTIFQTFPVNVTEYTYITGELLPQIPRRNNLRKFTVKRYQVNVSGFKFKRRYKRHVTVFITETIVKCVSAGYLLSLTALIIHGNYKDLSVFDFLTRRN